MNEIHSNNSEYNNKDYMDFNLSDIQFINYNELRDKNSMNNNKKS